MLGRKIEDDAGTERDGKPRQEPPGADFGDCPFAQLRRDGELGARPRSTRRRPQSPDRPRPRAASRPALVRHRALPHTNSRATTGGRMLHEACAFWRAQPSARRRSAASSINCRSCRRPARRRRAVRSRL
jgi:hypothetical protein